MDKEKTFFQNENVTITNARFMVGSHTFVMSNITSIKTSQEEPDRTEPIVLIVIGLVALIAGANIWVVGAFAGTGILWLLAKKTIYHVMLTTAGGETSALSSEQREYIEKVVQSLNDAIVACG